MKINSTLLAIVLFTLFSCSHQEEVVEAPKAYSRETNDFFNRIENSRSNSFGNRIYSIENDSNKERVKRNDSVDSRESLENVVIERRALPNYESPSNTDHSYGKRSTNPPPVAAERMKKPAPLKKDIPEKLSDSAIEIEQLMSYHCMDKRKLSRFNNDQNLCNDYTQRVLKSCTNNKTINRQTVACVSSKLKKG